MSFPPTPSSATTDEFVAMCTLADADMHIAHLESVIRSLAKSLDEAQLRSIEARNPGIDMAEVSAARAVGKGYYTESLLRWPR